MKAFVIHQYGKENPMHAVEIPEPELGQNEVLVQIHAASLNPIDYKIKKGDFKLILRYKLPLVLGHDFSGVVIRVGSAVQVFNVGDEVYARPADYRIGTLAELITVNANDLAIKPKSISMEEAASIPLVGLTAWQALIDRGNLKKGQKVFIQAGSGGVGSFAIQLAKHLGATVATTTSTSNVDWVKNLGADIVIDYTKEDFEKILHDYDVVLHSQDNSVLEKSLRVLKPGGKLISISGPPDPNFADDFKLSPLMKWVVWLLSFSVRKKTKRNDINFSFLFMKSNGQQLQQITSLIDSNTIRPVIDRVFPFESTNEAMAYVENGRTKGKVVIKVK